jgi:uncharacterized protein YajQ (UPF0234 family)
METKEPQVGQVITSQKSGVSGKVLETVANPSGQTYRVRIETEDGIEKWTTWTIE